MADKKSATLPEGTKITGSAELIARLTGKKVAEKPTSPTVADLQAEIDKRNADRDEEHKIVPAGTKKDDLAAALKADDENQS